MLLDVSYECAIDMLLDVSYECAIEYSIGSGSSIEYGNRIFYRIEVL